MYCITTRSADMSGWIWRPAIKLYADFRLCEGVDAPNPLVVQESTVLFFEKEKNGLSSSE